MFLVIQGVCFFSPRCREIQSLQYAFNNTVTTKHILPDGIVTETNILERLGVLGKFLINLWL